MDSRTRRCRRISKDAWLSRLTMAFFPKSTPSIAQRRNANVQISRSSSQCNVKPQTSVRAAVLAREALVNPVTQLWYARQGIITPEMEFIAIRENLDASAAARMLRIGDSLERCFEIARNDLASAINMPANRFGASNPKRDHARIRARRSRARPRHHSRQHQSSRIRADDHRPQFPGEDQRQHRQQRRRVVASRKKSRRCVGPRNGAPTP